MYKNSFGEFPELVINKAGGLPVSVAAEAVAVARAIESVSVEGNKATIKLANGSEVLLTIGKTVYADLVVNGQVIELFNAKPFIEALKIYRGEVLEMSNTMDVYFLAAYRQRGAAYLPLDKVPPMNCVESFL